MATYFLVRRWGAAPLFAAYALLAQAQVAGTTTRYAYNAAGDQTQIIDPLNKVTVQEYNVLGQLTKVVNANNEAIRYAYDGLGQMVSVTDARNLVTTSTIDGHGDVKQVSSPDTGVTSSTYDAAGNIMTRVDAKAQRSTYQHDALNRLTKLAYSDGSNVTYSYDQGQYGIGRLTGITDASGTTRYAYDIFGNLLSETRTFGARSYVTTYHYDPQDRLVGITYPSGRVIEYSLDAAGRISEVRAVKDGIREIIATQITYQPFAGLASLVFGNGQTYRRTYDANGRVVGYTLNGQNQSLSYDTADRVTGITNPSVNKTYAYDQIGQLVGEQRPTSSSTYTYDAVGNRLRKSLSGNITSYTYAAASNRLMQFQGVAVASDANGSITNNGSKTFAYDARGRLVSARTTIGTVNYVINALGQRVMKVTPTLSTSFHYDKRGTLIAETANGVFTDYVYLDSIPLAILK